MSSADVMHVKDELVQWIINSAYHSLKEEWDFNKNTVREHNDMLIRAARNSENGQDITIEPLPEFNYNIDQIRERADQLLEIYLDQYAKVSQVVKDNN